jgi:hypothetical protein
MRDQPQIKLNIIESDDFSRIQGGAFYHSPVSKNTDPQSKMDDFRQKASSVNADQLDIIFLKFCYVDMLAESNPKAVFEYYIKTINEIQKKNKGVKLIHFTVPLTIRQTGVKAWVKKIIGKPIYGEQENMKRFEYNQLLLNNFKGKEPVLDIAKIESTFPDGTRSFFEDSGKTYYSLAPEYTNDGGHLNELGRKRVAERLLLLLASLN